MNKSTFSECLWDFYRGLSPIDSPIDSQYHPELQPIETCWGVVKNYMTTHCDFTMKNFRKQLPSGFAKVTPRTCKSLITKVVKQEEKYWAEDSELYEETEEDVESFF